MFRDGNNLKDSTLPTGLVVKDTNSGISYNKANKLITALYMVTDIMDSAEPLKNKLRTLGLEIISDIPHRLKTAQENSRKIVSLLDIALTINLVSAMNLDILKREFLELERSLDEYLNINKQPVSLEEFLSQPDPSYTLPKETISSRFEHMGTNRVSYRPSQPSARVGVQKGSTLLQALSDKTNSLDIKTSETRAQDFMHLKKGRRDDILKLIKDKPDGLTIKDMSNLIKDTGIMSFREAGEKTLQRELMSMVKDGILNKKGEKRWSKYYTKIS